MFLTFTFILISSFILVKEILEISNKVYDIPKPNGYKGLIPTLLNNL